METVLLLGPAREAAGGVSSVATTATSVSAVCDELVARYGSGFTAVLAVSKIWIDGEPAAPHDPVVPGSEVSILPPVSGG